VKKHDLPRVGAGRHTEAPSTLEAFRRSADRSRLSTVLTVGDGHAIDFVNAAFCEELGETSNSLVGLALTDLFIDAPRAHQLFDRVLDSGTSDVTPGLRIRGPRNETRYATVIAQPILDAGHLRYGLAIHLIVNAGRRPIIRARGSGEYSAIELSSLKQANEALLVAGLREQVLAERAQRTANELKALLDAMTESVAVFDGRGDVMLVNPIEREMLGIDKPDITIDDYRGFELRNVDGTRLDFERDLLLPMLAGNQFVEREILFQRNGGERHLACSSGTVRDSDGNVVLVFKVCRDITELRDLEQLRERYVALISHDLRGPLSTARMAASLLSGGLDKPDVGIKLARTIERNLDHMDQMVRDLLDAQRIRAGQPVPLRIVECDLVSICKVVIDDLSMIYPQRLELRGETTLHGYWSPEELRRAAWNLAINGLKYGSANTPVVIEVARRDERAVVAVHNEGPPIPADEHTRLFSPYARTVRTGGPRGWGLGLTLVRGCVEAHGGTVTVQSDAVSGTTFTIELPFDARKPNDRQR